MNKERDMTNEIVKYHNDMNTVAFRKFTAEELNLFFAMCHKVREQGTRSLEYSFDEVRNLVGYKSRSIERLALDVRRTYQKMLGLTFGEVNGLNAKYFVLFTSFEINADEQIIKVKVNEEWEYILNQLDSDFTRFELEEFTHIRSTYAKTMYRLLKQFRQTGYVHIKIDEFRRVLHIPNSYRMTNIERRVLEPIKTELAPFFPNLKIKKVKAKKGNKIDSLEFYFSKETVLTYTGNSDQEKVFKDDNPVEGQISLDGYYNWIEEE